MSAVEEATISHDPAIGSGDKSKCLQSWIDTFERAFESSDGYTLSTGAVSALLHTLIAAKIRTERLVRERDYAQEETR